MQSRKEYAMKRPTARFFLFCTLAALSAATRVYADCDASVLNGQYAAINHGTIFDERLLIAGVGVATFDGDSQWTIYHPYYTTQGRGASHGPDVSGTFTVNADCSGTMLVEGTDQKVEFVIFNNGNEVTGIVDPGTTVNRVVTWEFKRQSRKDD